MKRSTTPMFCKQFPPLVMNATVWFDNVMQRSLVWEQSRKSELIHSLMCGYPVPFIYARKKQVKCSEIYKKSMAYIGLDKKWIDRIQAGKFTEDDLKYDGLKEEERQKIKSYIKLYNKYKKAIESGDNDTKTIYDVLDGKQRINAIADYISGKYSLTGIEPVTYIDEDGDEVTLDVNGFRYNELPEELKDNIKDSSITFCFIDDASDDELRKLFRKLNNGKPLSAKERNIANCVDITNIAGIGDHDVFTVALTEKAREKRTQIPMIMKIWAMLNQDIQNISFASSDFNILMMDTKTTKEEREEIVRVLDRFYAMFEYINETKEKKLAKAITKKMFSETHMVSLAPFVKRSLDEGINMELVADFISENFGDKMVSEDYQNACVSSSAKNVSIRRRNDALESAWEKFFETDADVDFGGAMNPPESEE